MHPTYDEALQAVRDRNEITPTTSGEHTRDVENAEYLRGQIELIADLWGTPGVETGVRVEEITAHVFEHSNVPEGCTGYVQEGGGGIQHDGATCPVHEHPELDQSEPGAPGNDDDRYDLSPDDSPEFTQVYVVLTTGDEFIVETEEDAETSVNNTYARILDGEAIGARSIRTRTEALYRFPPALVKYLAVTP